MQALKKRAREYHRDIVAMYADVKTPRLVSIFGYNGDAYASVNFFLCFCH